MNDSAAPAEVLSAILGVQGDIGAVGIAKGRKNQQQGYQFRGIDEMYNALSPLLTAHHLVILPRMLERTVNERATKSGGALFSVVVCAEFDFTSTLDASVRTVRMYGEAMDSADKATNKAMSAAYKYAVMQTFAIPTEGTPDADETTPEPLAAPTATGAMDALFDAADRAIEAFNAGREVQAYEQVAHLVSNEEKQVLWDYLKNHPGLRAAIKRLAAADATASPATTTEDNQQGENA